MRWTLVLLTACIDTNLEPIDMTGPVIATASPSSGSEINLQPSWSLGFSKPLYRPSVERPAYTVLLTTRYKLDANGDPELDDFGQPEPLMSEAMRDDFHAGNGGLDSDSYRARTVPISVGLDETGTQVTITTLEELRPLTEYQLVFSKQIRDTDGNRLLVSDCQPHIVNKPADCSREEEVEFDYKLIYTTEAGPAVWIASDLPGDSEGPLPAGAVPVNRETFELRFDRGLAPAPAGSILLKVSTEDNITVPLTPEVLGNTVTLRLPTLAEEPNHQGFCANGLATWRLCPDTAYEIVVTSSLTDVEGAPARASSRAFRSSSEPDESPPVVTEPVVVQVGETQATLSWVTDEPSSTELVFEGVTQIGNPSTCVPGDPCTHEFDLTGLELGQTYTVTAVSRDLALNTWSSDALEIVPVELPDVVITETHANALEEGGIGEFVEIYNYGETDLDLSGWALVRSGTETGADLPENTVVPARSVAVLVDETFNNAPYPSLSPSAIIEINLFSLVNSNLYLDLIDLEGRTIDATSELDSNIDGRSLVRDRVDTDTFCDGPPTPGEWQANSCAGQ